MPFTAFAEIPSLLTSRLRGHRPDRPWIATRAVHELDRLIQPDWNVLEFGSGRSTAWYAARAGSVISLEHEPTWHQYVKTQLRKAGRSNVELRLVPLTDFHREATGLPDDAFDLVVVDCNDVGDPDTTGRVGIVAQAMSKIKRGGYLVLDNSDRQAYANIERHLAQWPVTRYIGLQVEPLTASETSIYSHPPGASFGVR